MAEAMLVPSLPAVHPGTGFLRVACSAGASALLSARATTPMKLLTPRCRGPAVWAYGCSFGGGIVTGDQLLTTIRVEAGARLFWGTQATTKVYRQRAARLEPSRQALTAQVAADAVLVSHPDPVACFAGSRLHQLQEFDLADGASLWAIDWYTAGRCARGERWQGEEMRSRFRLTRAGQVLMDEEVVLDERPGCAPLMERMAGRDLLATVVIMGPRLRGMAQALADWHRALPAGDQDGILSAWSPLAEGGVWRVAARSIAAGQERVLQEVDRLMDLMGGNPWRRRP